MTVHGLCTDCPSRSHDSRTIIFEIIVYAIMVSQVRHTANVVPVHRGGCYLIAPGPVTGQDVFSELGTSL